MSDPSNTNMSRGGFGRDERELELLAGYALGALEPGEESEVERLLLDADGRQFAMSLELAAAATTIAEMPPAPEPMPESLRVALAASATNRTAAPDTVREPARARPADDHGAREADIGPIRITAFAGWIAAAACLALAGIAWMPLSRQANIPETGGMAAGAPSMIRSELLARQGDVILAPWTALDEPDPTAVAAHGDIIWSTAEQVGVMRISGLAANDPQDFQYQLWIFDEDQKHPIDGGVFDIPEAANGDVMVAVDPKIAVSRPTMFAITVERPGGVVVSDRTRIALLGVEPKRISESAPTG